MRWFFLMSLGVVVFSLQGVGQEGLWNEKVKRYIDLYDEVAIEEMKLFGIPASVTLAQAVIESSAGGSALAREANNHFGIKCHKEWNGRRYHQDDDAPDECFRKYDNPAESYRDHSLFLTQRDRYKGLFALQLTDYKGWCYGLKSAGYATNPKYAEMLINLIESYQLYRYDDQRIIAGQDPDQSGLKRETEKPRFPGLATTGKRRGGREIFRNYGLRVIIATSDDNIYQISNDLSIDAGKLLRYNELPFATALRSGQIVYLQSKRKRAYTDSHIVIKGETLYDIAQAYGVRMDKLYRLNALEPGLEPREGVRLLLR